MTRNIRLYLSFYGPVRQNDRQWKSLMQPCNLVQVKRGLVFQAKLRVSVGSQKYLLKYQSLKSSFLSDCIGG